LTAEGLKAIEQSQKARTVMPVMPHQLMHHLLEPCPTSVSRQTPVLFHERTRSNRLLTRRKQLAAWAAERAAAAALQAAREKSLDDIIRADPTCVALREKISVVRERLFDRESEISALVAAVHAISESGVWATAPEEDYWQRIQQRIGEEVGYLCAAPGGYTLTPAGQLEARCLGLGPLVENRLKGAPLGVPPTG
jgi:hypothetical protein